jgi:phosphatidylglycerol:prolipoprotein diacylglycerol transferase
MYPVIFELEGGTIFSYGVFRLLSYVVAAALLVMTTKRLNEPRGYAVRAAVAMIAGVLIGGRLGFVLVNWREPWTVAQMLNTSGGFVAFTGILGGILALLAVAIAKGRPVGSAFDLVTPSVVGAWAVGNIGCFLAGCCVGAPTALPWGLRFFADATPPELRGLPAHPAQLYSLCVELAVIGLLFGWPRRFSGELFLRALAALLLMRIGLAVAGVGPGSSFSITTVIYAVVVCMAVGLLVALRHKAQRGPPMVSGHP